MGIQILTDAKSVSKEENYNQIMFEIQKRMVDIEMNRDQKKAIHNEIADMVILINKLSETEDINNELLEERKSDIERLFVPK